MPILVVGADHPVGLAIVRQCVAPDREVRAFVTDPDMAAELRSVGAKVAVGDLSDESHIGAAATRCFSMVLVLPAIADGRELAFGTPTDVPASWGRAAESAGVTRTIWVGDRIPDTRVAETAKVAIGDRSVDQIAREVADLDDLAKL